MERCTHCKAQVQSALRTLRMLLWRWRQGGQDLVMIQVPWLNPTGKVSVYRVPKRFGHSRTFNSSLPNATLAGVSMGIKVAGMKAQAGHTFTLISNARYILSGYNLAIMPKNL